MKYLTTELNKINSGKRYFIYYIISTIAYVHVKPQRNSTPIFIITINKCN